MKRIGKGKRRLAVVLSVLLAVSGLPAMAFAEGQAAQGLCEHHLEHTTECGYVEGQPCEHEVNGGGADREDPLGGEHLKDCYTDELICGYKVNGGLGRDEEAETTASDSEAEHTHTQECYALDCPHERGKHDDTCGYAEVQPCGYTCELCGKTDNEPEPKPGEETEQTACMLAEDCTLVDGHEGECVTEPGEGEKETSCTLTEGCTLPDGHEDACATELPPIDGALVKTITSWTFVGDDNLNEGELPLTSVSMEKQADLNTVVSMLPTGISAEIEGETETTQVNITRWSCPEYVQDVDNNWPVTGEFVFTAELPEGYACDPIPRVKALMGGAELYAGETGDFTVTGGNTKYTYSADTHTLTINDGADVTISGTTKQDKIVVASRATVKITLNGLNIDISDIDNACAFDMAGAVVTLTLAKDSNNSLKSGNSRAGLEVPSGASLTISGNGKLEVLGTGCGAGIGGGFNADGGEITISGGKVTAYAEDGAGIGGGGAGTRWQGDGGTGGAGGTIIISGADTIVNVTTEGSGAGIGGGGCISMNSGIGGSGTGADDKIIISGGTVTVNAHDGAGIGGGAGETGGAGGTIEITSGTITATSMNDIDCDNKIRQIG